MFKNSQEELFDQWLSEKLKETRPVGLAFSQKVIQQIEHCKAQELLKKAVRQERVARMTLILTIICGVGSLCCPPVLRIIYSVYKSGLIAFIQTIMEPSQINLGTAALVLLCLILAARSIWNRLLVEM